MATPSIGDNISDPSKVVASAAAARARSVTTPLVRDANETRSEHRGVSLQ